MSLTSVSFYILPLLVAFYFVKTYCSTATKEEDPNIATYEEVKNINSHPEKLLIDVREPEELKETGQIPFSINIPLSDLRRAFTLPDEYFVAQYGSKKPGLSAEIIFSCKTGRRAQQALDAVALLGYKNVKNYKGSWLDWAEREGLPK